MLGMLYLLVEVVRECGTSLSMGSSIPNSSQLFCPSVVDLGESTLAGCTLKSHGGTSAQGHLF